MNTLAIEMLTSSLDGRPQPFAWIAAVIDDAGVELDRFSSVVSLKPEWGFEVDEQDLRIQGYQEGELAIQNCIRDEGALFCEWLKPHFPEGFIRVATTGPFAVMEQGCIYAILDHDEDDRKIEVWSHYVNTAFLDHAANVPGWDNACWADPNNRQALLEHRLAFSLQALRTTVEPWFIYDAPDSVHRMTTQRQILREQREGQRQPPVTLTA